MGHSYAPASTQLPSENTQMEPSICYQLSLKVQGIEQIFPGLVKPTCTWFTSGLE